MFYEYDTGTENLATLAAKLAGYHHLAAATGIRTPVGFWITRPRREPHARQALAGAHHALPHPQPLIVLTGTPQPDLHNPERRAAPRAARGRPDHGRSGMAAAVPPPPPPPPGTRDPRRTRRPRGHRHRRGRLRPGAPARTRRRPATPGSSARAAASSSRALTPTRRTTPHDPRRPLRTRTAAVHTPAGVIRANPVRPGAGPNPTTAGQAAPDGKPVPGRERRAFRCPRPRRSRRPSPRPVPVLVPVWSTAMIKKSSRARGDLTHAHE